MVNLTKSGFQKPHARFMFMLLTELHEDGHKEAIREHQTALGIVTAGGDLNRLKMKAHAAARPSMCR